MNSVRDIFLTLVSALTLVQFLPRVEPARIPYAATPATSQATTPGLFQRLQSSFGSKSEIQQVSSTEIVPVRSTSKATANTIATPNGGTQRSAKFRPAGARAELYSGGNWVSVELVRPTRQGYVVRFPGQSVSYIVPTVDLRFENRESPTEDSAGPVSASAWHCGQWCSCQILQQDDHMFLIHLAGEPVTRNVWVNQRMLRFPRGENDSRADSDD